MNTDDDQKLLGNLEAKVDLLLVSQAEAAQNRQEILQRVASLEASLSWAKGAAWVIGAFATMAGTVSGWLTSTFLSGGFR